MVSRRSAYAITWWLGTVAFILLLLSLFSWFLIPHLPAEWQGSWFVSFWTTHDSTIGQVLAALVPATELIRRKIGNPDDAAALRDLLSQIASCYLNNDSSAAVSPNTTTAARPKKSNGRGRRKADPVSAPGEATAQEDPPRQISQSRRRVRATLFRYRVFGAYFSWTFWRRAAFRLHGRGNPSRWRLPHDGWMLPIARSGDSHQNSRSVFYCPGDREEEAEGIAGGCRAGNGWVLRVQNLPHVKDLADESGIRTYARDGHVSEEWVRCRLSEGRPLPRDLLGFALLVDGDLWGALVLDADEPDSIRQSDPRYEQIMISALVGLLRRF